MLIGAYRGEVPIQRFSRSRSGDDAYLATGRHGAGAGAERVADSSGRARGFRAAVREGAEAGRSRIQWARGGGWEKKGPCYIYEIYNVIILACAVQGVGWHQSRREWMRCGLGANGAGAEASQ